MDAILAAQTKALAARRRAPTCAFMPVVDGTVAARAADRRDRAGGLGAVPTLIGTTKDEMTLFTLLDLGARRARRRRASNRVLARQLRRPGREVLAALPRARTPTLDDRDLLTVIATDRVFRIPAIRLAEAAVDTAPTLHVPVHVGDAGVRRQAQELPRARAAVHVGRASTSPACRCSPATDPSARPSPTRCTRAWIAFARTGDPGWPAYDLDRRATQRFDTTVETVDDPAARAARALDRHRLGPRGHDTSWTP